MFVGREEQLSGNREHSGGNIPGQGRSVLINRQRQTAAGGLSLTYRKTDKAEQSEALHGTDKRARNACQGISRLCERSSNNDNCSAQVCADPRRPCQNCSWPMPRAHREAILNGPGLVSVQRAEQIRIMLHMGIRLWEHRPHGLSKCAERIPLWLISE